MEHTPKEKAQELFDKYRKTILISVHDSAGKYVGESLMCDESAKKAAIIAVREILNVLFQHHEIDYYKAVKTEIQNL